MEPFYTFMAIVSLLILSGAAVAVGDVQSQDTQTQTIVISSSENGFQKVIQDDADDIYNAVNNVLLGREETELVKKMIVTAYKGTQRDSTYSADEIEINTRYQEFLDAAYQVVVDSATNSSALNDDINIMNSKKELI